MTAASSSSMVSERRPPVAVGLLFVAAALIVLAVDRNHHWSWPLFCWGVGVGVAGVGGSHLVARVGLRARQAVSAHGWTIYASFLLVSVAVAVLAAGLQSPAVDVVFTAYVALANFALPMFLLTRVKRPAVAGAHPYADAHPNADAHLCAAEAGCAAEACAACPLGAQAAPVKPA